MTMFETAQYRRVVRMPAWVWLLPVVLLIAGIALAGCGDDDSGDSDPARLMARYRDVRNSGDVDAVIAFYSGDAVIVGHPRDSVSIGEGNVALAGVDDLRRLELLVPFQRPENATEYLNIQVSGNRVTVDQRFFNDTGECFGGTSNEVTIEDDKITRYEWATTDQSLCE